MSDIPDLKAIRARLKLSQAQMAERLGVDRTSIIHMEKGRRGPRGSTLKLLEMLAEEQGPADTTAEPEVAA